MREEPLLALCIGVSYLSLAASRRVADRSRAVLTGFAFLQEYERRRDCPQVGRRCLQRQFCVR